MGYTTNQHTYCDIIDSLIRKNASFALYSLPESDQLALVLQDGGGSQTFHNMDQLNGKKGFVIAPYHISLEHPVVLIRPDVSLRGEEQIFNFLSQNRDKISQSEIEEKNETDSSQDSFDQYLNAFNKFQSVLSSGEIEKLVLSRTHTIPIDGTFSVGKTFLEAHAKYPNNFTYVYNTPETGCWMGSSPELLLSGTNNKWRTVALAGTKKISDQITDWDKKNTTEQEIVTRYMQQQLNDQGFDFTQSSTTTIQTGNLEHLKTEFAFETNKQPQIGSLLNLLHPTPAINGFPKREAAKFIIENEGYDRSYYSGFSGCLDMDDQTNIFVNLRCMNIAPPHIRLYAGGGIMPSSDLETEWKETENKLQIMLSVIKKA